MHRTIVVGIASAAGLSASLGVMASVVTTPTQDSATLAAALHPTGLVIDSVTIHNGVPGQFGTYSDFSLPPVTIQDGVVLSSGNVAELGPIPEATQPWYDPSSPPSQVNSQMFLGTDTGGTPEFDTFGFDRGNIENFWGSYDVASIRVEFTLDSPSQIKFDFLFGSVEFPYWTGQFTDAFIVFLDGTDPADQICFDATGSAVQVGSSFSGWETTADQNSAFSNPHGMLHHLTTTSAVLSAGTHVLIFEVGDVNDQILDSAVFISNLRTGVGNEGTDPTEDCPADLNSDDTVDGADLGILLGNWGKDEDGDLNNDGTVDGADLGALLGQWGDCPSSVDPD